MPDVLKCARAVSVPDKTFDAESGTPRFQFRWLLVALLPLTVLLSSCDSTQDIKSTTQQTNADVPNRNFATVVGRVVQNGSGVGSGSQEFTPVAGATIYAYVEGRKATTLTDTDGFFALANIPVTENGTQGSSNGGGFTLTIYAEKMGWIAFDNSVTAAAPTGTQSTAYQVDMGPLGMSPLALQVTSNVIHDSTLYLGNGGVENNVSRDYLSDVASNITLTFNMPVDTTYTGTTFVELLSPAGAAVPFAGSWSADGMTFTLDPTPDLTADSNDATRYRTRFVHLAKALDGRAAFSELDNVEIAFNVVSPTHGGLLTTQAPALSPQMDTTVVGGVTGKFVGYEFNTAGFYRKRTIGGSADYVDAGNVYTGVGTVTISWPAVANASSYTLYYRNSKSTVGDWVVHLTFTKAQVDANNMFVTAVNLNALLGGDSLLSAGETVSFLVTASNSDGIESSISGVAPLVIADNHNPTVASASTAGQNDATPLSATSKVDVTVIFDEIMGTTGTAQPVLAALSGVMTAVDVSAATPSWNSTTSWKSSGASLTFNATNTTLSSNAPIFANALKLASVGSLMVGDTVLIGDGTSATSWEGPYTVSLIKSDDATGRIGLAVNLTLPFASGAPVRLVSSAAVPGLTYFTPTAMTANAPRGATTLTVADGSRLYPNMVVDLWRYDENGFLSIAGSYTLKTVSGNTLTLTTPLSVALNGGSMVAFTSVGNISTGVVSAAPIQPLPRATATGNLAYDIQFDTNAVNTTLTANQASGAPDNFTNRILVASATGIGVNDYVTVAASAASSTLTADVDNVTATLPVVSGAQFQVGDVLRLPGAELKFTTGVAVAAASTNLPMTPAAAVIAGEAVLISDPAFSSKVTAAAASGTALLTVADVTGLAPGQAITISDAYQLNEGAVILSIATNTLTLTGNLAGSWASNAVVTRALLGFSAAVQTSTATSPIVLTAAVGVNLSTLATVNVTRLTEDVTVTAIAINNLTVTRGGGAGASHHANATTLNLRSIPEVRRVTSITGDQLTLSAALQFVHRLGAAVTKDPQGDMVFTAALPAGIAIGDAVVIDTLSDASFANTVADRVQATIQAIDTTVNTVTVTTAAARPRVDYTTATVTFMGDAAVVSAAVDSNANAVRSTSGNRVNLSNGVSK